MNTVPLGDLVQKIDKIDPRLKFGDGKFTYVDIGSVSQITKVIETPQTLPCSEAPSRARQVIFKDDVLVSTVRPNLNAVARVPEEFDGTIGSTGFSVLRPDQEKLEPSYLYHWVRTSAFVGKMMSQATGQSYPAVSDKIVKASKIPLPPLEEQKRIAGILDQADALRRLRTRAVDKLNNLGQAIFQEMFGAARGSGGKMVQLGDLASRITKGESPKWQGHEYQDDGSLFVTSENVGWGELLLKKKKFVPIEFHEKLSRSQLKDGDLLINLVGASIGRACLFSGWSKEANINQAVAVISLNDQSKHLNAYTLAYVLSEIGQNYLLGSRVDGARANVSLKNIRELPVYLPSHSDLVKYSDRTAHLDLQKLNLEAALNNLEALFSSLQHRAFRGEL